MKKLNLSASSKVAFAALVSMAAAEFSGVLLTMGEHPPVAFVIELILLALAALVFTRRWWASGLAAVLSGLFVLGSISGVISTLAEARILDFIFALVFMGLAAVAVLAGFRATLENYRNRRNVRA